jgi:hypothetical protein
MSKETSLLKELVQLRELIQSGNPPMHHKGICSWLIWNHVIPTDSFIGLCHKWPKCVHSTDTDGNTYKGIAFPVINHEEYTKAYNTNTQWSNPTRLEFIDWAIDHLSNQ